jgi:diamine N-acetyltransferase
LPQNKPITEACMDIAYKKISEGEIPLVQNLAQSIWREAFKKMLSAQQMAFMLDKMYSSETIKQELALGYCWDLIQLDQTSRGYMSYYVLDDSTIKLSKIYIRKGYRGKGVLENALERVSEFARAHKRTSLLLTVNKNNARAIKAYTKNNFEIVDGIILEIGNGFVMDDYIMKKPL